MTKTIVCLLLFVCTCLVASAKPPIDREKVPAWVKPYPDYENPSTNYEYSDGYGVILSENQVHVGKETKYYHFKRKIFSEIGVQNGSEISVLYDPEYQQLTFHQVVIHRKGKTIDKLNVNDFKVLQRETGSEELVYDGKLSAILTLNDVRVGDVIEYSFSIKGQNPIYNGKFFTSFYLGFYDPCDLIIERIITPSNQKLTYQLHQTDLEPVIEKNDSETTYEWFLQDAKNIIPDDQMPAWYDPYPFVWVSEYASWQELNNWSLPFYQATVKKNGALSNKIAAIKKENALQPERIEAALQFVQDEVRYLGMENGVGAYQPFSPDKVLEQRFGDCKDKSLLLVTMLRSMDIEAYPALVSTYAGPVLDTWLPTPSAFNHCIVQVKLDHKTFWYDPTISYQAGSYDQIYFPNYQKALVIRQGTTDLTDIENYGLSKTEVTEHFIVSDFDSAAVMEVKTKYYGLKADQQRKYFAQSSLEQISKNYLNYYTNTYPEISSGVNIRFEDDTQHNIFTTLESYTIQHFWLPYDSANTNNIQCTVYAQMLRDQLVNPSSIVRTAPVAMDFPNEFEHNLIFTLPEPWSVTEKEEKIEDAGIYFGCKIHGNGSEVEINYQYKVLKPFIDADEGKILVANHNKIADMLGYSLFYSKGIGESFSANWLFMIAGLLLLGLSVYLATKLYAYHPESHTMKEPISLGGWLILFALGLLASPFINLFSIFNNDYLNQEVWGRISDPDSAFYNLGLALLFFLEFAYHVMALVMGILLLILFMKKRSSFPQLVSLVMALQFLIPLVLALGVSQLNLMDTSDLQDSYQEIFRSFVRAAIWIPYMNHSQRVKDTFTVTQFETIKEPAQSF